MDGLIQHLIPQPVQTWGAEFSMLKIQGRSNLESPAHSLNAFTSAICLMHLLRCFPCSLRFEMNTHSMWALISWPVAEEAEARTPHEKWQGTLSTQETRLAAAWGPSDLLCIIPLWEWESLRLPWSKDPHFGSGWVHTIKRKTNLALAENVTNLSIYFWACNLEVFLFLKK